MAKIAPVKILILVVSSNKSDFARELLNNLGACAVWSFLGHGTGKSGIMDILGLNNPEQAVFISVVPTKNSTQILGALCKDLDLYKDRMGMALTIPLGAISRDTLNAFLDVQKQNEMELKVFEEQQRKEQAELEQKERVEDVK